MPGALDPCEDPARAAAPCAGDYSWVYGGGAGGADDVGNDVAVLSDGSVLVTGWYSGSARFGVGQSAATRFAEPLSNSYAFVARYEADGTLAWVKRAGGTGNTVGTSIAALPDGSALVTGSFTGTATFGSGEAGETVFTVAAGADVADVFLARYAPDGALVWVSHAHGGGRFDSGFGVAALADGSAVITGSFSGRTIFGPGETGETALESAGDGGYTDAFVARFDDNGTLLWAKRAGGSNADDGVSVAALADGSTLVTGHFFATATFGQGESGETQLTAVGLNGGPFVARFDPDGTLAWASQEGGDQDGEPGYDIAALPDGSSFVAGGSLLRYDAAGNLLWRRSAGTSIGVAVAGDGTALVSGQLLGSTTFGYGEPTEMVLRTSSNAQAFVARYAADGSLIWARSAGGRAVRIAALSDGGSVFTGRFTGPCTFGAGESRERRLASAGGTDIFVARHDADGLLAWVESAGGGGEDFFNDVCAFADGSWVAAGTFRGITLLGPPADGSGVLASEGDAEHDDLFLARYADDGSLAWTVRAGGSGSDYLRGVAALPDGSVLVTGTFGDAATFGPGEPQETVLLTSRGTGGMFIARYAPDGTLTWAKHADAPWPMDIAALPDGSSLIVGTLLRTATFGPGEPNETIISIGDTSIQSDMFIARYAADGTLLWAKRSGGPDTYNEVARAVAALPDGSALVTGRYDVRATCIAAKRTKPC